MTLTIIIGLPCSGKTYLSGILKTKTYDDFIFNFYSGDLVRDLKAGLDICITDPRLCDYEIFKRYMRIFEEIIPQQEIFLYLFENNHEYCKKNTNGKNVAKFIDFYAKIYKLDNYLDYKHIILPVHKP